MRVNKKVIILGGGVGGLSAAHELIERNTSSHNYDIEIYEKDLTIPGGKARSLPVPLLSETMSIIAGTSSISITQMIISSIAGLFPAALIYAITGAYALTLDSGLYSFILVIGIAGIFWVAGHFIKKSKSK